MSNIRSLPMWKVFPDTLAESSPAEYADGPQGDSVGMEVEIYNNKGDPCIDDGNFEEESLASFPPQLCYRRCWDAVCLASHEVAAAGEAINNEGKNEVASDSGTMNDSVAPGDSVGMEVEIYNLKGDPCIDDDNFEEESLASFPPQGCHRICRDALAYHEVAAAGSVINIDDIDETLEERCSDDGENTAPDGSGGARVEIDESKGEHGIDDDASTAPDGSGGLGVVIDESKG